MEEVLEIYNAYAYLFGEHEVVGAFIGNADNSIADY